MLLKSKFTSLLLIPYSCGEKIENREEQYGRNYSI